MGDNGLYLKCGDFDVCLENFINLLLLNYVMNVLLIALSRDLIQF